MKRRELIKVGSALFGGLSVGALAGYNVNSKKEVPEEENNDDSIIVPKQTAIYEYSIPMPFNKELIDELYEFNNTLKKGKIITLYSSFPPPMAESIHPMFGSVRGKNEKIKTIDDYLQYTKYAASKGFKCVFTFNTSRPLMSQENEEFVKILIDTFSKLYENGIKDVKIANPYVLTLFQKYLPQINIHLATTAEYHSVREYQNTLRMTPTIQSVNIATDENKNFTLLRSLKELSPNVKLELLVNELHCIKFCPARHFHPCTNLLGFNCSQYIAGEPLLQLAKTNVIHPWELEYYSAIGINNFKLTSTSGPRHALNEIDFIKNYAKCVEEGTKQYSANDLLEKIYYGEDRVFSIKFKDNYKLTDVIKHLPDIKHFVKNGKNCASSCGTYCDYCYQCARELAEMQV